MCNSTGVRVLSTTPQFDICGQRVRTVVEFALESRPACLSAVVAYVRESLEQLNFANQSIIIRTCVALSELLDNALYHGNLELSSELRTDEAFEWEEAVAERRTLSPYKDRQIYVRTELSPVEAVISIRDEGPGFDPLMLPDPTDPGKIDCACGRGVFLVRNFMDEVWYNDKGNEVTLVKRVI